MLPVITVHRRIPVKDSLRTAIHTVGSFKYTRQGVVLALAALMDVVASEKQNKISPPTAWFQLEDETGTFIFDVYDADYVDVTKTAIEHSKARRRLAAEFAKERREEDEAFLAAVNGQDMPRILDRKGEIASHVKVGYESGLKIAKDISGAGE